MQVTSCPSCGSQYNTAHMQSGAQFQCSNCGAMVLVQAAAPAQPQAQSQAMQQPMQQQAQPQAQVQRRSNMPAAGGARRAGGLPSGNRSRPGAAAPRGQQAGYGQPQGGYQQQGFEQGPAGFPGVPKKKGNTGLIIGSIVGGMAILIFIIVMATSGGTTMNEADMEVINAITSWEKGQQLPSEDTLQKAMAIRSAKNFPDQTKEMLFNSNLSAIETLKANAVVDKYNADYRSYKEKARKAILATSNEFVAALKAKDKTKLASLIDWNLYHRYLSGSGEDAMVQASFPGENLKLMKEGKRVYYRSPLSHKIEYKVVKDMKDGKQVVNVEGKPQNKYVVTGAQLYSVSELQSKGVDHIIKYYGTDVVTSRIDRDKENEIKVKGTPNIPGAPKGSNFTERFYGDVNLTNGKGAHYEIGNKDLRIFIGGEWGSSSAQVVAIYDRLLDQWLTRIRDEAFHERNSGNSNAGGDAWREGMNNGNGDNGNGETESGDPDTPAESYGPDSVISDTNADLPRGHLRGLLEKAIENQETIANDQKNFESFEKASTAEKIAAFGFAADLIMTVDNYAGDDEKASIVPKLSAYFDGCFTGEYMDDIVSQEWVYFMQKSKRGMSHKEYAWMCMKLYNAYKHKK